MNQNPLPQIKIGLSFGVSEPLNPEREASIDWKTVRDDANPIEESIPYTAREIALFENVEISSGQIFSEIPHADALRKNQRRKLSLELNSGGTFTSDFSLQFLEVGGETEAKAEGAEENKEPTTVLLVDDESFVITVAEQVLRRNGFSVIVAGNGREAVSLFRKNLGEISLVITDLAMPVMDGKATFRAIRALDPCVPIIVCSGFLPDLSIFASEVGSEPDGFVQKPYEIRTMLKTVEMALGRDREK